MFLKILNREYRIRYDNELAFVSLRALKLFYLDLNFRASIYIYLCLENIFFFSKHLRKVLLFRYGISVGKNAKIKPGLKLEHCHGIVIGNFADIGNNCILYQNVTIGQNKGLYPKIGDNVIVYPNSTIAGPIRIGDCSIIGANSFVNHDFPEYSVIAGNPAKIIRMMR